MRKTGGRSERRGGTNAGDETVKSRRQCPRLASCFREFILGFALLTSLENMCYSLCGEYHGVCTRLTEDIIIIRTIIIIRQSCSSTIGILVEMALRYSVERKQFTIAFAHSPSSCENPPFGASRPTPVIFLAMSLVHPNPLILNFIFSPFHMSPCQMRTLVFVASP